jgi:tripartite-type tricarboxylate transporter receptor subunit TctC
VPSIKWQMTSALAVFICASVINIRDAQADAVADFYRNKPVSIVVAAPPGGGYDLLARMVARHLPKHAPGQPTIIVRNMPGAGGIVAMNYLFNSAARDGSIVGAMQNNAPFEPLFGAKGANYDPMKLNWLGTPSTETALLLVWHSVPVTNYKDLRSRELTMGSTGASSNTSLWAKIFSETLGARLKIVVGYPGQVDILLGMERGEIDGYPGNFYSAMAAARPTWIPDGKVRVLVQVGPRREPSLPNVPLLSDLLDNENDRLLVQQASAPIAIGRPYAFPPDVPGDRVRAMRDAFWAVVNDNDFEQEAQKLRLNTEGRARGEQVQETIGRAYASPEAVTRRLRALLGS